MAGTTRRALLSVSDKSDLLPFAQGLVALGFELYSTGGTRKFLEEGGLTVIDVAAYTGFPEMLDGRVKTLHPKIFGGILARDDHPEDAEALSAHGIARFELVIVNLYPFAATIARPDASFADCIEQIDIGGPSLVRATAKNHLFVNIVTQPSQYQEVLAELQTSGSTSLTTRKKLALAAFEVTAEYDRTIRDYLTRQLAAESPAAQSDAVFPAQLDLSFTRLQTLRYGENPHQAAAVYALPSPPSGSLAQATQLHGKELSYNNLLDLDSALSIVRGLPGPAVSVIKHNNPCGAATADTVVSAFRQAYDGDPVSAFGGVLGFNRPVDEATALALAEPGRFIEAIAAPSFTPEAVKVLTTKPKWKANVRLVVVGPLVPLIGRTTVQQLVGGMLAQAADDELDDPNTWKVVTTRQPTAEQWEDLKFAWHLVRYVKSNAITLALKGMLVGVGAGQMSRVDSVQIALTKAGTRTEGAALGSDAFFPFPDSIDLAARAGVHACIQPGGSKQDPEVIAACNRLAVAMVFTGKRHFRH